MASRLKQYTTGLKKLLVKAFVVESYIEDQGIVEERLSVCRACEHLNSEMKCAECRCYMDIKAKTEINIDITDPLLRSEVTHCPLGKWGDTEIANYYREQKGLPIIKNQIQ